MHKSCIRLLLVLFAFSILGSACTKANSNQEAILSNGAVASPDKYGSQTAIDILNKGGNAVDAAVATAFALAVTYPEAGNIGGGGFMTIYMDGKPYFIDYRETAPAKADKNIFLDEKGNVVPNLSTYSYKAIGVPGTVAGMWEIHKKFGKLTWQEVLRPAIDLAQNGFVVDKNLYDNYLDTVEYAPKDSYFNEYFGSLKPNQTLVQKELAEVLTKIAKEGPKGFYEGEVAQKISSQILSHGGLITLDDLKQYKAQWRDPLVFDWKGMTVISSPPPSSGGFALGQLLNMKTMVFQKAGEVKPFSAKYYHLISEIEKRVYADREVYLGDPSFVKVPIKELLDPKYLERRASEVNFTAISPTGEVQPGLNNGKKETTHFSIVDKWGNAASNTYTLNGWFGSTVVIKGTGIVMNNEMDDFSAKPGVPNQFGVMGNDSNEVGPKKRPLSSMSPTIITKDNKLEMVIGTPGGSHIPTTVAQVLFNFYDNNLSLSKAVFEPRYHHQLHPKDTIFIERSNTYPNINKELTKMGYTMTGEELIEGDIQAIHIKDGKAYPVSDNRARGVSITTEK